MCPLRRASWLTLFFTVACVAKDRKDSGTTRDSTPAKPAASVPAAAVRVASITGFKTPESVRYDPADDIFFVSNINGKPAEHDGNGFISRLKGDGTVDSLHFIQSGRGGAVLDAPKGLALVGDTLWVADIDHVRAFNKRTGAPVATLDLRAQHATFLNDVVAAPDGVIYITDTSVDGSFKHVGTDRIFAIAPGRRVTVAAVGDTLGGPNGIAWDPTANHFVLGGFRTKSVFSWMPGQPPQFLASGPGSYDGVEVLADGRVLVTSWADSTISVIVGDHLSPVVRGVGAPADIGIDTKRHRIALPRFQDDRVELWSIPSR